tara:strand:- start:6530 stop:8560 length:2031 start_codon:yes stop_codon:yes gene_type:complete
MLVSVTIRATFNLRDNANTLIIKDLTDYAAQNVATSDIKGVINITTSEGQYYNNQNFSNPDIVPGINTEKSFSIPRDLQNSIITGDYTITYKAQDSSDSTIASSTIELDFNHTTPSAIMNTSVDVYMPMLLAVDQTSYNTTVAPTLDRTLQLFYPASLDKDPVVTTENNVYTQEFYAMGLNSVQHQASLNSLLTYEYASYYWVTDSVVCVKNIDVVNPSDGCAVYDVIRNTYDQWQAYEGRDVKKSQEIKAVFYEQISLLTTIDTSIKCGYTKDVEEYAQKILELGNGVNPNCQTQPKTPQVVVGVGGVLNAINSGTIVLPSDGLDGRGVSTATINSQGHLIITYTDGYVQDAGAAQGKNGRGITSTRLEGDDLIVLYSDSSEDNIGNVTGNGIQSSSYDQNSGKVTFTYTDGAKFTTGDLRGEDGTSIPDDFSGFAKLLVNDGSNNVSWIGSPLVSMPLIHPAITGSGSNINASGDSLQSALLDNLYNNKVKVGDLRQFIGGQAQGWYVYTKAGYNNQSFRWVRQDYGQWFDVSSSITKTSRVTNIAKLQMQRTPSGFNLQGKITVNVNSTGSAQIFNYSSVFSDVTSSDLSFSAILDSPTDDDDANLYWNKRIYVNKGSNVISLVPYKNTSILTNATIYLNLSIHTGYASDNSGGSTPTLPTAATLDDSTFIIL